MTRTPMIMEYHPFQQDPVTALADVCLYCGRAQGDAYWHMGALRVHWRQRRWEDTAHIARASRPSRGVCGAGVKYVAPRAPEAMVRHCADCIDGYVAERESALRSAYWPRLQLPDHEQGARARAKLRAANAAEERRALERGRGAGDILGMSMSLAHGKEQPR